MSEHTTTPHASPKDSITLNSLSVSHTNQATKKENITTKMKMNVEVFNSSTEDNELETKLRRNFGQGFGQAFCYQSPRNQ